MPEHEHKDSGVPRRWTRKRRAFWITMAAMAIAGLLYLWLPYRVAMVQAFFWLGGSRVMIPAEYHALDEPAYRPTQNVTRYPPDLEVLGLELHGEAKAIPLKRLAWHLVLNDHLGGEPVVVTYCTVTEAALAYRARCQGQTLHFTPARLARNNLVLHDRETGSSWQQFTGQAIDGPLAESHLVRLEVARLPLAEWQRLHPDGTILEPTGEHTDCCTPNDSCPVMRYFPSEPFLLQRPTREDTRLPRKALVLGDISEPGEPVALAATPKTDAAEKLPRGSVRCYWFAWVEFHPETQYLPLGPVTAGERFNQGLNSEGR